MKNRIAKENICIKLKHLLTVTSNLQIKPQTKLKILQLYIHSQLSFEFKIYNFGSTWIEQNLDSMCVNQVRLWMKMPVSSCVSEVMSMPKYKGGFGIPSFKESYEKMGLSKRLSLKSSEDGDINQIWKDTRSNFVEHETLIERYHSKNSAKQALCDIQSERAQSHFFGLESQGLPAKAVIENIDSRNILAWSGFVDGLSETLFNFARRAFQQQLPTAANLFRWKRSASPNCTLCGQETPQTNKHLLSNCSAPISLERFTRRHNTILKLVVDWLNSVLDGDHHLLADIASSEIDQVEKVFKSTCRPDIVIHDNSTITVLELTVCHETNLCKSKLYKQSKYKNIKDLRQAPFSKHTVSVCTLEVSVLGFISNMSDFCKLVKIPKMTRDTQNGIIYSALSCSASAIISLMCFSETLASL